MSYFEIFLIGVGLSMDAFAASVCRGLTMKRLRVDHAFVISLYFGLFQAIMPAAGWYLGSRFESRISDIDHWIAFFLLAFIGGKMIFDALRGEAGPNENEYRLSHKELLILAVATSIDALAVGVSFGMMGVRVAPACGIIGLTTFLLSFAGVFIGNAFGSKLKDRARLLGGIVLILLGTKILLEHLGII